MEHRILDMVSSPADLKVLSNEELAILAREVREEIITVTSETGGHVGSSLGAVEIILAVHSLINCPKDKFVFDVGHQAYAHKLVTGRLDQFKTLRTYGGLSGFPKPGESPCDVHPSGHASDSLSVALGLAKARDLSGTDEKVVALIGDAALSGGMAFEALNHIGQAQTPLVIILNDNEMSISRNVGALMKHLGYMRASSQYRQTRDSVQEVLESSGALGTALANFGRNVKESMKQFVLPRAMIFEQLGILCTAPIDGHDIGALRETLATVLATDAPVLMHVVTRKGAGYAPAVREPEKFHGIGPFNIETGELKKKPASAPSYTSVFGKALIEEARRDDRIVAITAAMKDGTGLSAFAEAFPTRFIDSGIAEEHAVGLASGLAVGGMKPVVAIYSTFLQRALDQLIINNALPNLDVVFAIDRAGIVGEDGPTHHGMFDLAYTRMVPHMRVLAPSDEAELVHALHTALALGGPFAIRYPRGSAEGVPLPDEPEVLEVGRARVMREGSDVAILAFGRMVSRARGAAELLAARGIEARVVDMRWAKPLDADEIARAAQTRLVVTVEGGICAGGAGEGVLAELSRQGSDVPTLVLGIPDTFVPQGKADLLLHDLGLDAEGIAASITKRLNAQDK
ncbi:MULTISPECIES: 1-deoxy-D-xylulose-5-phosphate synthase [Gordonibacter]|uniref:1-deoxy-D-xylulose-5-phosphate synthase n=1 Tax=Gordonibacter faecis TaxID=3047475 RepID=A0ABT7DJB0_9ACTN|nr:MULTISPECIES: 1-deoxy-D-xylulose-5-phosphate synthase [unclassified Gordonibacter]MDJ1649611.1 1-deoxy-D-xylulose-5-phosphate synthase [Gordonibacter sp. KGMB12511]HIW76432.1 1-deoxy-D-xylulose-5-phosphate synthase [Candidatus Gordonibacter avicola]